jgi:hypothetical protein
LVFLLKPNIPNADWQYIHGIADEEKVKVKELKFDDDPEGAASYASTGLGLSTLDDSLFRAYIPDAEGIQKNKVFSEEFLISGKKILVPASLDTADDNDDDDADDDDEEEEEEEEENYLRRGGKRQKRRKNDEDNEIDDCDGDESDSRDGDSENLPDDDLVYKDEDGKDTCIDPAVVDTLQEIEKEVEMLKAKKNKALHLNEIIPLLEEFWKKENTLSKSMVDRWNIAIQSILRGIGNFCCIFKFYCLLMVCLSARRIFIFQLLPFNYNMYIMQLLQTI